MTSRLVIHLGDMKFEFEGSEDFLREEIPGLLERAVKLHVPFRTGTKKRHPREEQAMRTDEDGKSHSPLVELADEIGVEVKDIRGAFDPSTEPPYLHIDKYFWAALKKNTPKTGPNAIPATTLAATLLALWLDKAGLGDVTLERVSEAAEASDLSGKQAERSINNCEWLQLRGNRVMINPAEVEQATAVVKAFCTKSEIEK